MTEPIDPRHFQANERTLLAWVRTGLALVAFGFVIDRLALWFRYEMHRDDSGSLALGTAAIALGVACQLIGAGRFVAMRRSLVGNRPFVPGTSGPLVVVVLVAGLGLALLIYLLFA